MSLFEHTDCLVVEFQTSVGSPDGCEHERRWDQYQMSDELVRADFELWLASTGEHYAEAPRYILRAAYAAGMSDAETAMMDCYSLDRNR